MDLENTMLSEITQMEKDKNHMISQKATNEQTNKLVDTVHNGGYQG